MEINKNRYITGIGMIRKGLNYIGFSIEDIIDIVNYIDKKYKDRA